MADFGRSAPRPRARRFVGDAEPVDDPRLRKGVPQRVGLVGATGLIGTTLIRVSSASDIARMVGIARREMEMPEGAMMEMFVASPDKWGEVRARHDMEKGGQGRSGLSRGRSGLNRQHRQSRQRGRDREHGPYQLCRCRSGFEHAVP